jgi:glycosyltransferase involved in cell wall biosynthesis
VHVLTTDYLPAKFRDGRAEVMVGTFRDEGVPIHRLPVHLRVESIGQPLLKGLGRALRRLEPDVIHSHGLIGFVPLQTATYARLTGTPLFYDVHVDNDNFHLDTSIKRLGFEAYKRGPLEAIVCQARAVMPVNPFARRFVERDLGISSEKVRLLPLGVDTDRFHPDIDGSNAIRADLGIEEEVLFIFAGNVEPRKDLETLFEAFTALRECHEDIHLLVIGGGEEAYIRSLHRRTMAEGVVDRTTFAGRVPNEDLPNYYDAADIGIWPGKLGVAMIEALGTGLPIIVCDTPATSFLTANENGLVFEHGDVRALTERLETYVVDSNLRERHGDRSLALARKELAWRRIAERSIDIYREE